MGKRRRKGGGGEEEVTAVGGNGAGGDGVGGDGAGFVREEWQRRMDQGDEAEEAIRAVFAPLAWAKVAVRALAKLGHEAQVELQT
ncbi:hypothetical protein LOK49_LG08G00936 [Camellia lanceoleosa]|uniref:Uncharacterized protein n=1 Tax=Camellia lanceoleosa TaxID=1840588 RepID=A0ACC0GT50_9ERIC|nr:hypothetical protein LOK49_LG08G00936 [Camellia lanceoleosa]